VILAANEDPVDLLGKRLRYDSSGPERPWLTPYVAEVVAVRVPVPGVVSDVYVLLAGRWRYVPLAEVERVPAAEVRS
jgi:hypothetical protein